MVSEASDLDHKKLKKKAKQAQGQASGLIIMKLHSVFSPETDPNFPGVYNSFMARSNPRKKQPEGHVGASAEPRDVCSSLEPPSLLPNPCLVSVLPPPLLVSSGDIIESAQIFRSMDFEA